MFKEKQDFWVRWMPIVIMVMLWGWLFAANWRMGTILSGWDTLHPEFDLGRYAERAWNGAWQEHQGLGAAASQSHISELTRLPLVWLLMQALPLSMVRYAFMALMGLFGMLGMYGYVVGGLLAGWRSRWKWWVGMLSGVFYLFNVGTMQHFLLPLEMFAVHFASLPWIWWMMHRYLAAGKIRDLWWLGLVGVFSASMSHTATLFYMQLLMMVGYSFVVAVLERKKVLFWRGLLVGLVMVLVNLFWMGPNLYYVFEHGHEVADSTIHHLFSNSAFLRSREYGTVDNLLRLKNFLFSWQLYDFHANRFVPIMQDWEAHVERWEVRIWAYIGWVLAGLGWVTLLWKKRYLGAGLVVVMLGAGFFWINQNPPFTLLYGWLKKLMPLFVGEALRFPFTKFSMFLIFGLAALMAMGHVWMLERGKRGWRAFYLILVLGMTLVSMRPALEGKYISQAMQVEMPERYQALFGWFEQQDTRGRILKLPLRSYWGWEYYDWEYQGAGFTWFGLDQPTFDREFDRWNLLNETAYLQFKTVFNQALLTPNDAQAIENLKQVWRKYGVDYLLVDESVITPMDMSDRLKLEEIRRLFGSMHIPIGFEREGLVAYELPEFEEEASSLVVVEKDWRYEVWDKALFDRGNYITDINKALSLQPLVYPLTNFDTRINEGVRIETVDGMVRIERVVPLVGDYNLLIPGYTGEPVWPMAIWASRDQGGMHVRVTGSRPGLEVNGGVVYEPVVQEQRFDFVASSEADYLFVDETSFDLFALTDKERLVGYLPTTHSGDVVVSTARKTEQTGNDVFTELIEEGEFVYDFVDPEMQSLPIHGAISLTVILPDIGVNNVDSFARNQEYNCDVFGRGSVQEIMADGRRVFRANDEGSSCNYVDYEDLAGFKTFLVRLMGENRDGEGLRLYLRDNDTLDNNLEELLFGKFDYAGVIYSPGNQGQILSLHTKAYGSTGSENLVDYINVMPIPVDWLRQIKLEPRAGISTIPSSLVVTNGQAYDDGWIAMLAGKRLPHVLVNGWENGWVIAEENDIARVKMFFWPQYLSWLGWAVLGIVLGWLGIKARKT